MQGRNRCIGDPGLVISPVDATAAAQAVALLIRVAGWAETVGPRLWTADDFPLDQYVAHARAGELIGGFRAGQLVACMLLRSQDPIFWPEAVEGDALYLHKLAVDRSAAGQGLGAAMIHWACETARARGTWALRLDTLPAGPLPDFYGRLGFAFVDPGPRDFNGRVMVRMQRRLDQGILAT
jgi:GNAT superfamily N-acetyltransferase